MIGGLRRLGLVCSLEAKDRIRYSRAASEAMAGSALLRSGLAGGGPARFDRLLDAYRLSGSPAFRDRARRRLAPTLDGPGLAGWAERRPARPGYPDLDAPPDRGLILKAPGPGGEKGVLLVMLEYNLLRLLRRAGDLAALERDYTIIASTGWSPTDYDALAEAMGRLRGPLYVQACNYAEIPRIEGFHPRLRCLPTIGCDWLDPADFGPKPRAERSIDLLMVANWAPFKRHWHLFRALGSLPRSARVVLIGQPDSGHTVEGARRMARALGVRQDVEFVDRADPAAVRRHQADSKAAVILSRREGCCVAAAEALMAGAALGLLRGAHVGPVAYVNHRTGLLLDGDRLGRDLCRLVDDSVGLDPRGWAVGRIDCRTSAAKLDRLLRDAAAADGRPWTAGIATPRWRPYPEYADPADLDRLRPAYEALRRSGPGLFGEACVKRSIAFGSI